MNSLYFLWISVLSSMEKLSFFILGGGVIYETSYYPFLASGSLESVHCAPTRCSQRTYHIRSLQVGRSLVD